MNIIEKMEKARESVVELDSGIKLTIRRPTDLDMADRPEQGVARDHMDYWTQFVTGWQGMTELDLYPGGTGDPVDFDLEVFRMWFEDRPGDWEKLINAIRGSWTAWHQKQETNSKNS